MDIYIDYQLVFEHFHEDFEDRVRHLMLKGWQPLGAPAISGTDRFRYQQVMVKPYPPITFTLEEIPHTHPKRFQVKEERASRDDGI